MELMLLNKQLHNPLLEQYNYKKEGDFADFSIPDDSVWVRPIAKDVITKISLATEEIRDLAKSKIK